MTGRTPTRLGIRNWIPQDSPVHVRRSVVWPDYIKNKATKQP